MNYTHNDSIVLAKEISAQDIELTYRLLENGADGTCGYSALISMRKAYGEKEEFFIPDFAGNQETALALFEKLWKNTVLPCEVEAIYSDGFEEIL